ncbi:MAG: response regulator [bacterium]|nr:response regulator [bacterium]
MAPNSVLIVEDEAGLRELYEDELKKAGFLVFAVGNGEEALSVAAERQPSAIILDIMLPGMSGLDVLAKLRATEATKATPVFLLTALEETDDRARGISLGASEYLAKTEVSPALVIEKIKAAIGQPAPNTDNQPTPNTEPVNNDNGSS